MPTERVRTRVPMPDPTFDGDLPVRREGPAGGLPSVEPLLPPDGAPNVLIVLLDDAGFGASSACGGLPHRDGPTVTGR